MHTDSHSLYCSLPKLSADMSSLTLAVLSSNLSALFQINPCLSTVTLTLVVLTNQSHYTGYINLASVPWISLFMLLFTVPLFPCLPSPFYARIWSQEERMMSIKNWSGKQKALHHLCVLLYIKLYVCVCVFHCHSSAPHILLTLTNHTGLNITLTQWHNITPCADRQRSFARVLLLRGLSVFVFKEE